MSMVHMAGLKRLHFSMRRAGTERARFAIRYNHVTFDCLFLTDIEFYEFVLAAIGHPGVVFVFEVRRGYLINDDFDPALGSGLANLLNTGAHSQNELVPQSFLRQIDAVIPAECGGTPRVTTADVLRIYGRNVEENDKIYFKGWLRNGLGRHVTPENLDKTRRCFGQKIHDSCKRQNISSCWSADPAEEVAFSVPKTP